VRILLSGEELGPRKIYKRRLYTCQANERGSSSRTTPGKRGRFHQPDTEYGLPLAVTIELRKADGTWVPASANELSCEESDESSHDEVHADELEETNHASQPFSATYLSNDPGMLVEEMCETLHMTPMRTDCLDFSGLGQVWSTVGAADEGTFLQGSTALDPVFAGLQTFGMARPLPLLNQDGFTSTDLTSQFVDLLQTCLWTSRFAMFEASLRQIGTFWALCFVPVLVVPADQDQVLTQRISWQADAFMRCRRLCKTQAPNSSCTLPHELPLGLERLIGWLITRTGQTWYDRYCPYSQASRLLLRAAGTN
jgi:hypothetical protein